MRPWFDRTFPRNLPLDAAPDLLARLRRNADRLADALEGLPGPLLIYRRDGRWSIQEHAGHLLDLEALWSQRLDDYARGEAVLRAADLQNRGTFEAHHNDSQPADIVSAFRAARGNVVTRLEAMDDAALGRTALHPRLQQPMSVVDLAFFVAEHDDHHLDTISEATAALRSSPVYALDLLNTIDGVAPRLLAVADERPAARPAPGKWSPKEVIGHLIDSASNNHQRFVRAMFQDDLVFPGYAQADWVGIQRYQESPWADLVTLWASFNRHLGRFMCAVPEAVRLKLHHRHNLDVLACHPVPASEPTTLDYFMADYVWHVHHHLKQIPF